MAISADDTAGLNWIFEWPGLSCRAGNDACHARIAGPKEPS
jgi:hypothetical protein